MITETELMSINRRLIEIRYKLEEERESVHLKYLQGVQEDIQWIIDRENNAEKIEPPKSSCAMPSCKNIDTPACFVCKNMELFEPREF